MRQSVTGKSKSKKHEPITSSDQTVSMDQSKTRIKPFRLKFEPVIGPCCLLLLLLRNTLTHIVILRRFNVRRVLVLNALRAMGELWDELAEHILDTGQWLEVLGVAPQVEIKSNFRKHVIML